MERFEDTPLSEREQQEILNLAAALQRQEQEGRSLRDVEAAGLALGIDPRYVRAAALQRNRSGYDRPLTIRVVLLFLAYLPAGVYGLAAAGHFANGTTGILVALMASLVVGLCIPRAKSWRLAGMALPASALFIVLVAQRFAFGLTNPVDFLRGEWTNAVALTVAESLVVAVAHAIADRERRRLQQWKDARELRQ